MSIDITLLQLLRERERFVKLARSVPERALDPGIAALLKDMGAYFHEFPNAVRCEAPQFMTWWRLGRGKKAKEETAAKIGAIMSRVDQGCDPVLEAGMMRRLAEAAAAADTVALATKYHDGEEIDLRQGLQAIAEEYDSFVLADADDPTLACDIESLLAEDEDDTGIHWRLNCLNRSMRPLRAGDFGLFAARPDRGKGTFIASEATFWAPQVEKEFGPDRPIVIMVNEGPGKRVWPRLYSAAIGIDTDGLIKQSNAGTLRQSYADSVGGNSNVIQIVEIHGRSAYEVEKMLARLNPSIWVIDMLAHVRWGGSGANGGTRTDQIAEAQAQWARELCVKREMIGMATVQLSAEAEGIQFPPMSQLKDSRTGLQGANDFIIIAGSSNDPMLATSRYIGVPKNKNRRAGAPGNPMAEVMFDAQRARYEDSPT
jgi:replicative DNA helicase